MNARSTQMLALRLPECEVKPVTERAWELRVTRSKLVRVALARLADLTDADLREAIGRIPDGRFRRRPSDR
jgi:hypothetical protein